MPREPIRIANCSGFYGDRFSAAREMLEGGPLDVLTGDYLAELTMFLLWRARERDPAGGYAATFLRQMEDVLGLALERGVRIVANAGGLNPAGLSARLRDLCARLGLRARVAHIEGDDLLARLPAVQAAGQALAHADTGRPLAEAGGRTVTANAYLGGWGIAEALRGGADVVVGGRIADASLVVGPAAWHFGWARDDWDRLAGAAVGGHILECGPQATGGNYAFFTEVPDLRHPGFPIAEVFADGSAVITKHPGTGGLVSVGTVTAQLLYEVEGPRYVTPDVVARFDSAVVTPDGPDRVRISGTRGHPAPPTSKVGIQLLGGYRNGVTLVLTGLDVDAKARVAVEALRPVLDACAQADVQLLRTDKPNAPAGEEASAFGIAWPALVPADLVEEVVVFEDGRRVRVPAPPRAATAPGLAPEARVSAPPAGPTRRAPLGAAFGARSGDKGGNANVGVWARSDTGYAWLAAQLTVERFKELVAEAAPLEVRRYLFPNLRAVNFVIVGLLGDGAAASSRLDPQAKGLGEYLRSRLVDLPVSLLEAT